MVCLCRSVLLFFLVVRIQLLVFTGQSIILIASTPSRLITVSAMHLRLTLPLSLLKCLALTHMTLLVFPVFCAAARLLPINLLRLRHTQIMRVWIKPSAIALN